MPFALLFAAFALVLDMLHAVTRGQRDRGVEVVVLRQQVRMYQRQAKRTPLCWPCAPFHPIIDPPRSGEKFGGMWLLGHPPYLEVKTEGDSSMVGKRERPEDAYGRDSRDPRDTVKAGLPEPQSPVMPHSSPAARLRRGHPDSAPKRPTREPSAGWAGRNDLSKGDGRGTYVTLGRR